MQPEQWTLLGITLEAWLTIFAVIVGPTMALWLQRVSEARREQRNRKLWIFREIWATRAARLSTRHVEALNLIELEFNPTRTTDAKVIDAWKIYLDDLNHNPTPAQQEAHFQKRDQSFVDLIYELGQYLNFSFDKVAVKRNVYTPIAHGDLEADQDLIRRGLVELLTGTRALSTLTWVMPQPTDTPLTGLPPEQKQPLIEAPRSTEPTESGR